MSDIFSAGGSPFGGPSSRTCVVRISRGCAGLDVTIVSRGVDARLSNAATRFESVSITGSSTDVMLLLTLDASVFCIFSRLALKSATSAADGAATSVAGGAATVATGALADGGTVGASTVAAGALPAGVGGFAFSFF